MAILVIVSVLLFLSVCLGNPIEKRQATCYSGVYIIIAPPHDSNGPGLQQTLVNNVTAAIPNSGVYVVPYDTSTTNYAAALAQGQQLMVQQIQSYAASCPSTPIVLMGYSEGGIVMMNTLCGSNEGTGQLSAQYRANIIAAIAYGEETFVPGQAWDRGTCTTGPSENPRPNPASCNRFAYKILDYCDSGDNACCDGTDPNAHFEYPNAYDYKATHFIHVRYNNKKGIT